MPCTPPLPSHRFQYLGAGRWRVTGGAVESGGRWYPATDGGEPGLVLAAEVVTVNDDAVGADGMGWATPRAALAGLLRRVVSLLGLMRGDLCAHTVHVDLRAGRLEVRP